MSLVGGLVWKAHGVVDHVTYNTKDIRGIKKQLKWIIEHMNGGLLPNEFEEADD